MSDRQLQALPDAGHATPVPDGSAIVSLIERAARDPNVDIDKLERLMSMQERMLARQAEIAFNAAMQAAQSEMPCVFRDKNNEQTRSRYTSLERIIESIKPVITAHGLSISYGTADSPLPNHYRIVAKVAHSAGHARDYFADIPTDANGMKGTANKTPTHAFGSTMSYGRRYLLLMVFNIALTNEDDDGQAAGRRYHQAAAYDRNEEPDVIGAEGALSLQALVQSTKTSLPKFLAIFGVASLPEIPSHRLDEATRILQDRQRKVREAANA